MTITHDEMQRMPWTRDLMTDDELQQWVASRKAAGLAIDIKSCELGKWYADDADPYGMRRDLSEPVQIGTHRWGRSLESNGWINEGDLPPEKVAAMYDRIERGFHAWALAHPEEPRARAHLDMHF